MQSAYKIFTAFFLSFFIIACSGGGGISDEGSGGTTPPVTISITLEVDNDQISVAEPGTLTATVRDSTGAAVSTLVSFTLNNDSYGTFDPGTGEVSTNADGVATIKLNTAAINTGASITATTGTGETASVNVTMVGDGGEAGGGAQVSLVLTDSAGTPIQTISTLSPGKLTATVTGINKSVIVTFESPIGDLPIKSAVTDSEGKATVDIYAGSSLGAGEVTASLATNEVGKTIVVVGATNVVMGSGTPFTEGVAEVSTTNLSAGGTATISVQIQDDKGNPFTQPVDVNFSSTCATKTPAQAQISSPVSSSNGLATSTYLAQGCVGEDQINVTANAGGISLSAVGTINVLQADVGSIVFVSAEPENIGILGTGGVESSVVKFKVLDKNSNPVSNQNVLFELNTIIGGVALTPAQATTNNEGIVQTVVTTGTVATSVRVTATVDGSNPVISSQSKQLIISTGIPDQDSFSLSAEMLNAEGWVVENTEVKVTARMADAFNNPVPDGTTVSFTTEGGAIEDACQTINGACSVTWVSQLPRPEGQELFNEQGVQIRNPTAALRCHVLKINETDSGVCDINNDAQTRIYGNFYDQKYGGRATITATAIGEESFPDLNGNGRFDASEMNEFLTGKDVSGESFDLNDAFNDYNEDSVFNPQPDGQLIGFEGGALEELVDFNSNTIFDLKDGVYNGVLCSEPAHAGCADGVSDSKTLFVRRSLVMVMSGSKAVGTLPNDIFIRDKDGDHFGGSINIVGKGAAIVIFTISDLHNQQMPAGSKVSFSSSAGSVSSTSEIIWPSSNYNGGTQFKVSLKGEDEPNSGVFSAVVTTPNGTITEVVNIAVNIL
ncbi:invasin domain 3-containing protein [Shewanella woodyi]|uniref:Ig domain protein, group 1 domain protein n=1 Tax=Shewanella woodyi (strain ATCC 51908 / MS32) TaxID=392500 RepID=B1KNK8_SHEWM|nr:invasin domain 3-containing protein [Shewanella woodyi]ACA86085.1 Ig domain protein, group 1 domain protein [Shewanella woodyi ATCC 51908]